MKLINNDCLIACKELKDQNILVDSVVTDPPYHLQSIVSRFGKTSVDDANITGENAKKGANEYARLSKGFMGQAWDGGDIAFDPETWKIIMDVMKPGAHLVAFSASRNYHRMACAIEDAGFEIRDQIMWLYGTGFPKSKDLGDGWGTALKPAHEPIVLARKSLAENTNKKNMEVYGVGGINIDGCRISVTEDDAKKTDRPNCLGKIYKDKFDGNTYGENFGGISQGHDIRKGRWPANVVHDGSDEVVESFPIANSTRIENPNNPKYGSDRDPTSYNLGDDKEGVDYRDSGSASRFFYSAKVSKAERGEGNNHPTVKPISLMRYLCKLITPIGGLILDPFMGSGSTGIAAKLEKFDFIGIEREKSYFEIARSRIDSTDIKNNLWDLFE